MRGRDPRYLRYGVLLLLAAALVMAGAQWRTRLLRAFDSGAGLAVTLDAWVDPPAYTGLPPLYLAPGDTSVIAVPAGSILNLRAHNAAHAPGLSLGGALGLSTPPRFAGDNGEYADTRAHRRATRGCGCAPAAMSSATGASMPLPTSCR